MNKLLPLVLSAILLVHPVVAGAGTTISESMDNYITKMEFGCLEGVKMGERRARENVRISPWVIGGPILLPLAFLMNPTPSPELVREVPADQLNCFERAYNHEGKRRIQTASSVSSVLSLFALMSAYSLWGNR